MRQRITFLHEPQDAIDPKSIKVTSDTLIVSGLKAVKEHRITLGFEELPEEIKLVLDQSHELHLRYVNDITFDLISPYLSRLPPGLHVFYTPQRNATAHSDLLCPFITKHFEFDGDPRCITPEKSFTLLPTQRFQHSAAYEFYQPNVALPKTAFVDYLRHACALQDIQCQKGERALLDGAEYVDIDFDTISHTLTFTALWKSQNWNVQISNKDSKDRVEVGILSNEKPLELGELNLAGFLTVVGEDEKPSPTLFSFPARHHATESSYSAEFLIPTGLHPRLQLKISSGTPPADHETCSLHAYFKFPRVIFPDKYQFGDSLFLASKNLSSLRYVTSPVDLEAPEYVMNLWGSSFLLELAPPSASSGPWSAELPLHLRYLPPSDTGYREASVPWPVLFWACATEEGSKFTINPFDRVNLGYDGLFGPRTMFYHLTPGVKPGLGGDTRQPARQDLYNVLEVSVLRTDYNQWVETGTAAVVIAGFGWILFKLWRVWAKEGYTSHVKMEKKTQ